jgi:hypothetical protein
MGVALAVLYDVGRSVYRTYFEADVDRLLLDLAFADRVVGFNIDRFDLRCSPGTPIAIFAASARSTCSERSGGPSASAYRSTTSRR